jgi:superfamily II DNA or RNA helicase
VPELYDYQREAVDAARADLDTYGSACVVLATGLGKSPCFAIQAAEWIRDHPGDRVLIVVHTRHLVNTAFKRVREWAPHLTAGLVMGTRNETGAQIVVASRQTLVNRLDQITDVGLIIVDEVQYLPTAQYRAILDHYHTRLVGYTATLRRADGRGFGEFFPGGVSYERDVLWGIRNKRLIVPIGRKVVIPDLFLGGTTREWTDREVDSALADSIAPDLVVDAWLEHASGRKTLGFLPLVRTAELFAEAFRARGIHAEVVHGGLTEREQVEIKARHKPGTVVLNALIWTVGYDEPDIDCIIMGRPTRNIEFGIQMVGRGLRLDLTRPWEEQDCLLLYVTPGGTTRLFSTPDLSKEIEGKPDRDGASLLDLTLELDAGELEPEPDPFYDGPVDVVEFDPTRVRSSRKWLVTEGGRPFLRWERDRFVTVIQTRPGRWSVIWLTRNVHERVGGLKGGRTADTDLPLSLAMAAAEELAIEPRRPQARPSKDLVIAAQVYGVPITTGPEMSDRLDTVLASRRIDPLAGNWESRS